ncbi:phosphoglycerate mutase [Crocosphaera subtropica ATCC 51142]|uniref:Phosphoglycerate mutase n=1 Tax=Crocosphaera subtropica (strain ATCC 51142 / BH68) TaxID=43989 RepID=B1WRS1_CROS5|nr:histidine phosphatase family protein [Crocosphaera subtropica]ACB53512.1 phosphoglycerate mutase [Crocosphaera subtropica ATCC 51142]
MSLKLYFLRHGETTSSQTGTYCGRLDIELTPSGRQMAEDFAQTYKDLPWKAVYCSPLKRAIATAKPLCDLLNIPMELRHGLKEIYYGEWEGKTPDEVNREFHDDYVRWLADPGWNSPNGGEKGIDIARRSSEVLEEIEDKYETGNVLVVSHKATIRIMLCSLLGIDVGRFRDRIGMAVAAVSVVEMAEHGPLVHIMGDRSHIRTELRERQGT